MIWINSDKKEKIKIITTDQAKPLLVVDGEVWTDLNMIESIVPDAIETMNVLKGDAAFKKYGKKGLNGVIEITIKKN
jgi:S-adenosylmethionine/arginine decarboxylase-like enzyme